MDTVQFPKIGKNLELSASIENQLRERSARMKQKAEEELSTSNVKRPTSTSLAFNDSTSSSLSSPAKRSAFESKPKITYPIGGLRITRTPGRKETKNCVNLEDMIHKQNLISACVFSFFIGENELYDHLPLSDSPDAIPVYIGRDANQDPMVPEACRQAGISFKDKLTNKQLQSISSSLRLLYTKRYGKNYHAFYAWSPGSSHSKILLLVYPKFLRLVITSCNMMNIDTVLGDNHWYIHDLPKLSSQATYKPSSFEADLLTHMQALGTPDVFLNSIRGMYDYSTVKVHIITSIPSVCAGIKAEKHGLLRLRRIIQDFDLKLPEKGSEKFRLEICAASIGNLSSKWLNGFNDCALGKKMIGVADDGCAVPDLRLFYPSVGDIKKAHAFAQDAASNIGCHTRPWNSMPHEIKNVFHHYESKDIGCLFHQKLILAHNPQDTNAVPYYVYVGSTNLSQSAWGALEQDKKINEATCNIKLIKMSNFECGVVIPGHMIKGLLEPGTESWQDGIVPYVQTSSRYDLSKDRPWNDPRWAQNYQ